MNLNLPKRTVPTLLILAALIFAQTKVWQGERTSGDGIYLRTVPSGARISMTQAASIQGVNLKPLGKSPGPLPLSLDERSRFIFHVELPGYHQKTVEFSRESLASGQAVVKLRPLVSLLIPALYWVRDNRFLVPALIVLLIYLKRGFIPWLREEQAGEAERLDGRLRPGLKFHGYELLKRLGEGGTGETYLAKRADSALERYALKAFFNEGKSSPEIRAQLEREWKACLALDHPGLIRMFDWGEIHGTYYLVSEFVSGHPLESREGSAAEVCDWMIQLVAAVEYAHHHGIVHRDLKPANVLLDSAGHTRILDFGVAAKIGETAGGMQGTPGYMAPEQANGKVGPATDFYALGVVFYELLTGQKPFSGENPFAILNRQTQKAYRPATAVRPELPRVFDDLLEQLLEPDPQNRLQDSYRVTELLQLCKASLTSAAE